LILAEKQGVTLCTELLNSKVNHPGYAPAPLHSSNEPVGLDTLAREQVVPSVYELRP